MLRRKSLALTAAVVLAACGAEPTATLRAPEAPRLTLSAQIWGPSSVQPSDSACFWEAIPSGGTPPYVYVWYGGDNISGDGQFYYTTFDSSQPFLELRVTDAGGLGDQVVVYKSVTVSNQAQSC